jgi:hypothetical protein
MVLLLEVPMVALLHGGTNFTVTNASLASAWLKRSCAAQPARELRSLQTPKQRLQAYRGRNVGGEQRSGLHAGGTHGGAASSATL